jgi:hypothetical protein
VPPGKRDVLIFDGGHEDAVRGFGIRKFARVVSLRNAGGPLLLPFRAMSC